MAKSIKKIWLRVVGAVLVVGIVVGVIVNVTNKEERVISKIDITELVRPHWTSEDLENVTLTVDFV